MVFVHMCGYCHPEQQGLQQLREEDDAEVALIPDTLMYKPNLVKGKVAWIHKDFHNTAQYNHKRWHISVLKHQLIIHLMSCRFTQV